MHWAWSTGALIDLGRWDEAEAALTRARHYELPDVNELQVEAHGHLLETGRGQFESANRRAPRVRLLAERFGTGHAAVLAWLALWQDDPLAARAAIEDSPEDPFPRYRVWALAAGIRAEADLAVLARARHAEPELAEARARGAALLARLRAVVEDVVARVPILTRQMVTVRTEAEAEFARLEGRPDPDRWASAAAGWQQQDMPFETGYALMREAEATLEAGRDRSRAARALNEARVIAERLGAVPLRQAIERSRPAPESGSTRRPVHPRCQRPAIERAPEPAAPLGPCRDPIRPDAA